jgi:hypothetical protein
MNNNPFPKTLESTLFDVQQNYMDYENFNPTGYINQQLFLAEQLAKKAAQQKSTYKPLDMAEGSRPGSLDAAPKIKTLETVVIEAPGPKTLARERRKKMYLYIAVALVAAVFIYKFVKK